MLILTQHHSIDVVDLNKFPNSANVYSSSSPYYELMIEPMDSRRKEILKHQTEMKMGSANYHGLICAHYVYYFCQSNLKKD